MTAPQHCAHECVCNGIQVITNFKCPVDVGYWKSCKHDTRKSDAEPMRGDRWKQFADSMFKPSAAIAEHVGTLSVYGIPATQENAARVKIALEEHDERVREEERDRTHIREMIQAEKDNQSSAIISDDEALNIAYLRWRGAYNEHVWIVSESLRRGEHQ